MEDVSVKPQLRWVVPLIIAFTYASDFASKQWALSALSDGSYRPVLGDLFGLQLIFNPGAAFSFLSGSTWVFTILSVVVGLVIVRLLFTTTSTAWAIVLSMLLGGTIGNFTDRMIREPGVGVGHVVDFLNYNGFFIGNVADIYIVAAAAIIAVLAFMGIPLNATGDPDDE